MYIEQNSAQPVWRFCLYQTWASGTAEEALIEPGWRHGGTPPIHPLRNLLPALLNRISPLKLRGFEQIGAVGKLVTGDWIPRRAGSDGATNR